MKLNFALLLFPLLSVTLIFGSCDKGASKYQCSAYFPVKLINEATLFKVGESYTYPFVTNGILYNEILDSFSLERNEWEMVIEIASQEKSNALEADDCFIPQFVVIFKGGYHNYVSHLTVSLSCYQLKYMDNSGIHILTDDQFQDFTDWYIDVTEVSEEK